MFVSRKLAIFLPFRQRHQPARKKIVLPQMGRKALLKTTRPNSLATAGDCTADCSTQEKRISLAEIETREIGLSRF